MNKQVTKEDKFRLKDKHVDFLRYLMEGHKITVAHAKAGFSGKLMVAHQLKSKLKGYLKKVQEDEGFSRTRVIAEAVKLLKLPCVDSRGNEIKGISVAMKLDVMKFMDSLLPEARRRESPQITAFIIQKSVDATLAPAKGTQGVIDVPAEQVKISESPAQPARQGA